MRNKRGDYKWDVVIAIILGLIVLSLSLYFIFHEYFTKDDLDFEECRQSVVLRASIPNAGIGDYDYLSFKDEYPLKCKTAVIEITKKDLEKGNGGKIIAETMTRCWYLFGNGDYILFPSAVFSDGAIKAVGRIPGVGVNPFDTFCVPCARITLTSEAREYLNESLEGKIDIESSLKDLKIEGVSYFNYLRDVGNQFSPFDLATSSPFDLGGESLNITESNMRADFYNRATGIKDSPTFLGFEGSVVRSLSLPKYFHYDQGDLIITYGSLMSNNLGGIGDNVPFMIYFQIGQNPNPFEVLEEDMLDSLLHYDPPMCGSWEGVPA